MLKKREEIESAVQEAKLTAKEHEHSLWAMGASTDEEKIAVVKCQTAYNLYISGRYDESIEVLNEAKNMCPKFTSIYRLQAIIESDEGHIDKANTLMDEATKNEPNNGDLWFIWGNVNRKYKRYEKAYDCYKRALELGPNDPMYLATYALALRDHGKYEEADAYFTRALDLLPRSMRHQIINRAGKAENLRRWAQVLIKDKNFKAAQEKLAESKSIIMDTIKIDPLDFKLNMLLKSISLDLANFITMREGIEIARPLFQNCLDLALDSRGLIRFKDKEYSGKVYYFLAKHLQNISIKEAQFYLQKALHITPRESNFYPLIERLAENILNKIQITRQKGKITFFNIERKYGFIISERGAKYFFHVTAFPYRLSEETMLDLTNRLVSFDELIEPVKYGTPKATNIALEH